MFALRRDRVIEPSGIEAVARDCRRIPGSVVVLPVLPDGRIVLIRQYRHAAGQYLWELVAGHKEPDENCRGRSAGASWRRKPAIRARESESC